MYLNGYTHGPPTNTHHLEGEYVVLILTYLFSYRSQSYHIDGINVLNR